MATGYLWNWINKGHNAMEMRLQKLFSKSHLLVFGAGLFVVTAGAPLTDDEPVIDESRTPFRAIA